MTSTYDQNSVIKQLHYFSGIILSLFIGAHLFNQLYALTGPEAHIGLMETMRQIYRHPVVESMLLLAVLLQVITGLKLLFKRRRKQTAEKIQVYSGLYLSFFLIAHVSAVMIGRFAEKLDTNFHFASAGLNTYPLNLFFVPYYFLAVCSIALHIAALHFLKTKSKWSSYTIGSAGAVISLLIILGYINFFHWREVPPAYYQFMQKYFGKG